MKFFCAILLLFTQVVIAQSWQQISDFPGTARDDGANFKIGSKVYCGIGLEVGWTCPNEFYIFDLSTETWTTSTSFPSNQQRQYACGFSWNGNGYVFGGVNCSNNFLNDLWQFDTLTKNWSQKANMPAAGRSGSVSFIINDTVYILGGRTATQNAISDLWAYDPLSDNWVQKTSIPINGTWRGVSFSYNNQGLVGLGKNNLDQFNKKFFTYSAANSSWSEILNFNHEGRAYTGYAQNDSIAFLLGGLDSLDNINTSFEVIDLKTFSINSLQNFSSTPRKGCMTFTGNNSFYLTTGVSTTTRFNETWKLDMTVGIKELLQNEIQILLFPNPNHGQFKIITKNSAINELNIYNTFGCNILKMPIGTTETNLELQLSPGVYTCELILKNNRVLFQKLIIQ